MTDAPPNSEAVLRSWQENAYAWTSAVRDRSILSRTLVTNQAIIDAVMDCKPATVLDAGCGEGWLSQYLATNGIRVVGTDAVVALVEAARGAVNDGAAMAPEYLHVAYPDLLRALHGRRFDVVVCNFSLLDKNATAVLLQSVSQLLNPHGQLLIQTLHPAVIGSAESDGWREESWNGIGANFKGTAPWYFRTLASWHALFADSGLTLAKTVEPLHPHTGKPASIIFRLEAG